MKTAEEIEQSIKDNLPILFGGANEIDPALVTEKQNAFIDYLITASAPSLSSETSRYQSIVLYGSVFLVFVKFTQHLSPVPATLTLFYGIIVPLNTSLVEIYSLFLAVVVGFFLMKSWVDIERVRFSREKNKNAISDLVALIWGGLHKRNIQFAFWLRIFDAIARTRRVHDVGANTSGDNSAFQKFEASSQSQLNWESLHKNPTCAAEISRLEIYLTNLNEELAEAEKRFCELKSAEVTIAQPAEEKVFLPIGGDKETQKKWTDIQELMDKTEKLREASEADTKIREAYKATFEPWDNFNSCPKWLFCRVNLNE
jgi:hypothetical protein